MDKGDILMEKYGDIVFMEANLNAIRLFNLCKGFYFTDWRNSGLSLDAYMTLEVKCTCGECSLKGIEGGSNLMKDMLEWLNKHNINSPPDYNTIMHWVEIECEIINNTTSWTLAKDAIQNNN